MTRHLTCFGLCVALTVALSTAAPSPAQPGKGDGDDYRRFFKKPETPMESWNALQFEIDVGRFDLAAGHLRELLKKAPSKAQLIQIYEKDGITSVLRLRTFREWSKNAKVNAQAKADADDLARQVTKAVSDRLNDPVRIRALLDDLGKSREERNFALAEMIKIGVNVMPHLIDALRKADDAETRAPLLWAIKRLERETFPPLLAALDADDVALKLDVLDVLRARHTWASEQIVPRLWFVSASSKMHPDVRKKAKALLVDLTNVPEGRLPPAKVALTREAERYYQHKVRFPEAVTVWRWDGKNVVVGWPGAPPLRPSQAEEYYGLRYAREALALDPEYQPAQQVLLSLALEKALEKVGSIQPLSATMPAVNELLSKAHPELVIAILERSLRENKTPLVLATVRNLGERAEVGGIRPAATTQPPLVKALYYPDPRVQLAAVEALLRVPGTPVPRTSTRIVEVLARALAPVTADLGGGRKVLVAVGDEGWRDRVRGTVEATGAKVVAVGTGRDAMRELRKAGDFEAIVTESTLPLPGMALFLGQLRADVDVSRLPVVLAAVPDSPESREVMRRSLTAQRRLVALEDAVRPYRAELKAITEEQARRTGVIAKDKRSKEDNEAAVAVVVEEYDRKRDNLRGRFLGMVRLDQDAVKIDKEMQLLQLEYDRHAQLREESLRRFVERQPSVAVVSASALTDSTVLRAKLKASVREADVALTPAEQQAYAEKSIDMLARLARGSPKGYDVKPVAATLMNALRAGKLTEKGQLAAVSAVAQLPGASPQRELAAVVLDGARAPAVREAATRELSRHVQKFGPVLPPPQVTALRALASQPGLRPELKTQLGLLLGGLRPSERTTGERLRGYGFTPPGVIPPPP